MRDDEEKGQKTEGFPGRLGYVSWRVLQSMFVVKEGFLDRLEELFPVGTRAFGSVETYSDGSTDFSLLFCSEREDIWWQAAELFTVQGIPVEEGGRGGLLDEFWVQKVAMIRLTAKDENMFIMDE